MLEIIAAVMCTLFAGFLGSGILGNLLNWPDAGAICAIATMGSFILHACLSNHTNQDEADASDDLQSLENTDNTDTTDNTDNTDNGEKDE